MIYRTWEREDLEKLAALEKQCFACPWSLEMLESAYRYDYFFGYLAEEDGEIAGYACGVSLFDTAETDIVATAEKFRRRGIASALLTLLETEGQNRGATRMLLEVRPSNAPARTLYEKRGFRQIGVRKKYYPDGEDAIVMQKDL